MQRKLSERDQFINLLYNNDDLLISDDLAVEMLARYDSRVGFMESAKRTEYLNILTDH